MKVLLGVLVQATSIDVGEATVSGVSEETVTLSVDRVETEIGVFWETEICVAFLQISILTGDVLICRWIIACLLSVFNTQKNSTALSSGGNLCLQ